MYRIISIFSAILLFFISVSCDNSVTNTEEEATIVLTIQQSEKQGVTSSIQWTDRSEVTLNQSHLLNMSQREPYFFENEPTSLSITPGDALVGELESTEMSYHFYVNYDEGNRRDIWYQAQSYLLNAEEIQGLTIRESTSSDCS